ncbi:MAG: arylsulfatase [Candidatus Marinimicrobia bacterium]|nr:arylsulfatase [Candidatus Neomarinimicrobiota bacterium]
MNNRILFILSLAFILMSGSSCEKQARHPNIILFLADDMGYGDPQCYMPDSKIPTPNIDRLASTGIRFTDAHSPSSVCSPTRYAILTGRYAWRTRLKRGVLGPYNSPLIESDRLTIPKMLKQVSYQTACIGKWHLGMQWATNNNTELPELWGAYDQSQIDHRKAITGGPLTAGFDYYFGTDVPNFPPYLFIENDRELGFPSIPKPDTIYGNPGQMLPGWKLEDILPTLTQKAVSYIDNYAKANNDQPFFLYFASTSPHTPIVPALEFQGKSQAGPYGDLVHQTDYTLGQIMNALDRNGLTDNTLVIFTSDNGSPARAGDPHLHGRDFQVTGSVISKYDHNPNAPWRGMKADIWEGGHRVPFVMSWPGNVPKGQVSSEPISSVDIMASIAKLLDYELPNTAAEDSWDLSELMLGKNVGIAAVEMQIHEALVHHSIDGKFAIRQGKWKMIPQLGSGGWTQPKNVITDNSEIKGQLYDIYSDPDEKNNLWLDYPEIVEELQELLTKYQKEGRSTSSSGSL